MTITTLAELATIVPAHLQAACEKANAMAYALRLERNTCVLTSHALVAYLREVEGLDAAPVRVEVHVHARERGHGHALGWDGDGSRRRGAGPGMWHGHLAVVCGDFLLDPTIDQVNDGKVNLRPLVLPLPSGWNDGFPVIFTDAEGTDARYSKYRRQVGWKSAGDARPSHWRPVVDLMLEGDRLWGKS